MVHEEIRKSGYDGFLPAGLVITGGTARAARNFRVAGQILIYQRVLVLRWVAWSG